ncbi:MAG: mandelate racemase/muconate lactonizing enzyme family protein [Syntrophobacteria bacterium]
MHLKQIDLYQLQIPLCMPIKHSLANHTFSENLVVKVTTDAGVEGFGEGIARQYVTGETMQASLSYLLCYLIPRLKTLRVATVDDLLGALPRLPAAGGLARAPAAFCALELAILDAAGKTWQQSVADLLGGGDQPLVYSAVVTMMRRPRLEWLLHLVRDLRMAFVKIKVGGDQDLKLLSLAREILGDKVELRVDANGAWTAEEAVKRIAAMAAYGVSAVEQPVAKHDLQGLKQVAQRVPIPVIADESLCTEQDAGQLASLRACHVFNVRVSKCGGILAAARVQEIGSKQGIAAQLGCQVGETGILAAAGRQLAASREMLYLEGSYSNYVLREDIVNERVEFGPGGVAQALRGYGLGVSVKEEVVKRLAVMHRVIRL